MIISENSIRLITRQTLHVPLGSFEITDCRVRSIFGISVLHIGGIWNLLQDQTLLQSANFELYSFLSEIAVNLGIPLYGNVGTRHLGNGSSTSSTKYLI